MSEICPKCKSDEVFKNGNCTSCFKCHHAWDFKAPSWFCEKHKLNNMVGMICPKCFEDYNKNKAE